MTRTITSPRAGTQTPAASFSTGAPYAPEAWYRRYALRAVVIVVLVAVVGGASLAVARWARSSSALAAVEQFTVKPRTFSVVLKEKGELKAANSTDITCEVEGRSTIITLIPEGTAVKEGDLLVELASDQIEDRIRQDELKESNAITAFEAAKTELEIQRDKNASDIRKADLKIDLAGLALAKYEKGDWEQKHKDAQIAIEQANINLERRTEDFEAAKELREKNFITKTEYDEDYFDFRRAEWEVEKAEKAIEVLRKYTHVAELRQKESDLEEAVKERERVVKNADAEETKKFRAVEGKQKELELTQDQLAKFRRQKEKCRITAPAPGFVVYFSEGWRWGSEGQIKEGASVHERQTLLSLPDTSKMQVVVRVHETKTDKLRLGQRASVTVEGLPGHEFTGVVTKIAVVADSQNRWLNPDLKEYETEITLDPTDDMLKPGVTSHVQILVETVEDKLAVPVQTIYAKSGRRYVFSEQNGDIVPHEIKLGAIGTEWAHIADGLTEGEKILLAFSDEHKRLIPDLPIGQQGTREFLGGPPPQPSGTGQAGAQPGLSDQRHSEGLGAHSLKDAEATGLSHRQGTAQDEPQRDQQSAVQSEPQPRPSGDGRTAPQTDETVQDRKAEQQSEKKAPGIGHPAPSPSPSTTTS